MNALTSLGTNGAYVQLFATMEGDEVTLKATATEWCAMTGEMRKEEIGEKMVSVEEAIDAAEDLQGLSKEFLDNTGRGRGWFTKGVTFVAALSLFLMSEM